MSDADLALQAFLTDRPPDEPLEDLPARNGRVAPISVATDLDQRVAVLRSRLLHGIDGLATLPEPAPLIDGWIDLDSLAAIFAPWGSYKSFLAADMAGCVAAGITWHGHQTTPTRALYVIGEGAGGYHARMQAFMEANHLDELDNLIFLPEPVNLFDEHATETLAETARVEDVGFVVIDTLARSMVGADENSGRDMGRVVENMDAVRRASGACVAAVHHTGKNLDAGLRGHSSFAGAMDTVLRIDGADGYVTLKAEKQKYRESGHSLSFRLVPHLDSLAVEVAGLAPDRLAPNMVEILLTISETDLGAGVASSVLLDGTSVPRRTFFRHLKKLTELGLSANVGTPKQPRWSLTGAGFHVIQVPGATPVPTSVMTPSAPVGATVPPPLWGGTNGTDTRTRDDTNDEDEPF